MLRKLQIAGGVLIVILFIIVSALLTRGDDQPETLQEAGPVRRFDTSGFELVTPPVNLHFPAGHGPQPDYQTEWWYYTGNVESEDGRRFGYQLSFFRRALLPPDRALRRASDWATSQVCMAHVALSDIEAGGYQAFERLSRGAGDLAGTSAKPYSVWLENWQVEQINPEIEGCLPGLSAPCA